MAKITMTDIKNYAKKANKTFFNDSLDLNAIQFKTSSRATRTLGRFSVRNGRQSIMLAEILFDEKSEWITTLVHELVHAWQWQTGKPLDHGYSFKQMARTIGRIAPEVVITRTRSSEYIDQAVASRLENSGRKQYAVKKGDRIWFLRSIDRFTISQLKKSGYSVAQASKACGSVRHCKNIQSLLTARYYYSQKVVKQISSEFNISWKEL